MEDPQIDRSQLEPTSKVSSNWKRLFTGHLPFEHETTIFVLVSMLDVFMTYLLLRSGNFIESNPVADFFIRHWGGKGMIYFKMTMTGFVCVLTQIIAIKKPQYALFVLKLGTLVVGAVVVYSFVLMIRHG